jgi:hypothetical protein
MRACCFYVHLCPASSAWARAAATAVSKNRARANSLAARSLPATSPPMMETASSAELLAPGTAVKSAAPSKEQPSSSGPKTGPGKAGATRKLLSKCERMVLADQAR